VLGAAPQATATVTSSAANRPTCAAGRGLAGEVVVADIGIPLPCWMRIRPTLVEKHAGALGPRFPCRAPEDHKYRRGHLLIAGAR